MTAAENTAATAFAVDGQGAEYTPVAPAPAAVVESPGGVPQPPAELGMVGETAPQPQRAAEPAEDDGEQRGGLPAGQWALGGVSGLAIGGQILWQTAGVVGLAAGGAVAAGGAALYAKRKWGSRGRDGQRAQRTVKQTITKTSSPLGGKSGASRLGMTGAGRGQRSGRLGGLGGRSTSSRSGAASRGGVLGGSKGSAGRASGTAPGRSAFRSGASAKGRAGKAWASDGGGPGLGVPARKAAKTSGQAAKGAAGGSAAKEQKKEPKKGGRDAVNTPTATKKKDAPTSRFSRAAARWAEDSPGRFSSRAARWSRALDRAAYGRTGLWGRVLGWVFGWRQDGPEDAQTTPDQQEQQDQQERGEQQAPGPQDQQQTEQETPDPVRDHHRNRKADRRSRTMSSTTTSGGFPIAVAAAEVNTAAATYEPEDMWAVARDLGQLPDVFASFALAIRTYTQQLESQYPIHPAVVQEIGNLYMGLAHLASAAQEISPTFRRVHEADLVRQDAPRTNEQAWNV